MNNFKKKVDTLIWTKFFKLVKKFKKFRMKYYTIKNNFE